LEAGYDQSAMAREMALAGYELQYQLYTIATLRWLKRQLGDHFDPLRHFGGAFYLFIRGMGVRRRGYFSRAPGTAAAPKCLGAPYPRKNCGPLMVNNQKKILFDRLRHVDIDAGYTDTSGLLILFADLDLSDLDLMTIRDLLQYTPEPHDESLIGMLGLMFSALGEGSLCLVLDMDHLKKTVLQKAVPAVVKLVSRFLCRLDEGRYDTLD
jgi:hypothetical protein